MSNIYNYDLFISCAYEDKDSAQLLSRKLRELDFLTWFDAPEIEREGIFSEKIREAMENSAVCVLLLGVGGKSPWINDSVRSAIHSRLERTHGAFRVITVILPCVRTDFVGTLMGLMETPLTGYPPQWAVIRFKESLDEEDVLHELILRIRGVDPHDQSYRLEGSFGKSVNLRAQNALNVDWHNLILDLCSTSSDTFERRDDAPPQPDEVNIIEDMEESWGCDYAKQICDDSTSKIKLHQDSLILLNPVLREDYPLSLPEWNFKIGQNLRRSHSQWIKPPVYALMSSYGSKMATGMMMLLFSLLGFSLSNYLSSRNGQEELHASRGINLEATQNTSSTQSNPTGTQTSFKVTENTLSRKTKTARLGNQPFTRPSSTKLAEVTRAMIPSTPNLGVTPDSRSERPGLLNGAKMSNINKTSNLEEFSEPQITDEYKGQQRRKVAEMRRVFVEASIGEDIDENLKPLMLAAFIKKLRKNGIEGTINREDNVNGIAQLRFERQEIKSGSVLVVLLDNKREYVDAWDIPIDGKKAMGKVLCIAASQRLATEMGRSIKNAAAEFNKQELKSGDGNTRRFLDG